MSKLLIATSGTLGDIRPLLAIAMAARDKGHEILVATSAGYRELVATCGLSFEAFGDDSYLDSRQIRREIVRPETGFARFMAESSLWNLEEMFRRLVSLADNADVIVSTPLVTVAHLVAEYLQLPLVSGCLSPAVLLRNWGGATFDPYAREWRARLTALRSAHGLTRRSFPQMGRFAGDLTLGLYPRCLTSSPDPLLSMPKEVGYPILKVDAPVQDDLVEWMAQEPFILVSFGSFVDHRVEPLFDSMQKASVALGMRLLFISNHGAGTIAQAIGPRTRVERYVSHTSAMPCAKVVVHHGGAGSLATAARSGRPMVVVPFGLDQVYNAELLQQRGLAEVCDPDAISPDVIETVLRRSLERWSDRRCLWGDWSDVEAPSPSERALDAIEGVARLG